MPTHHFISGLPRSGSTLLSALLTQNPRFHASMSGPLAGLVGSLLERMSGQNEFSVFIDDQQRETIIRSVIEGFYKENKAEVIFDTSRAWCSHSTLINTLYPNAKIIACVREMPWIIDSIERLVDKKYMGLLGSPCLPTILITFSLMWQNLTNAPEPQGCIPFAPKYKNLNVTPYFPLIFLVALRRMHFGVIKKS